MSNDKKHTNKKRDDNLFKKTSQEANDFFGHTVDTSGKIVKSISGEGGLVGKATDSSGRILKGVSGSANDIIGKTSEVPGKLFRNTSRRGEKKNKSNQEEMDDQD